MQRTSKRRKPQRIPAGMKTVYVCHLFTIPFTKIRVDIDIDPQQTKNFLLTLLVAWALVATYLSQQHMV